MWLADSNVLIRAAALPGHPLQDWLLTHLPAISVVTRIEVLGYHRLRPGEEILLRVLLSSFNEYPIGARTAALAIGLRQQRKMPLADALIAATCLEHGLQLATRNTSDFDWIAGLIVDPLAAIAP
ncbi:MAG: type II toxin-antitoxin system VapC family toxin [Betaproteobacteria bacterium]|nr:type II toxin-antitoxin system VapC family toxin [Betaproteobacteria bacterium]